MFAHTGPIHNSCVQHSCFGVNCLDARRPPATPKWAPPINKRTKKKQQKKKKKASDKKKVSFVDENKVIDNAMGAKKTAKVRAHTHTHTHTYIFLCSYVSYGLMHICCLFWNSLQGDGC